MDVREAVAADADAISEVLRELVEAGKRTKASDAEFALSHYIDGPGRIRCSVAVGGDGRVLGFQSLKLAEAGNPYGTPVGWGIIGTHVRPSAARQGAGRHLFASTLEAARVAGLNKIEAYIGANNAEGLAYYERMGFRTYREPDGADVKVFELST